MSRSRWSLLLIALLFGAGQALAGPVEDDLDRSITLFAAGDTPQSRHLLSRLARIARDPSILARVELYLGLNDAVDGDDRSAEAHFAKALALDPELKPDPTHLKKKLIDQFEAARTKLAGELLVTTEPSTARALVLVDGQARGPAPLRVRLLPGAHRVEVVTDGAPPPGPTRAIVPAGRELRVVIAVSPPPGRPAAAQPVPSREPLPAPRPRRLWTWVALGTAAAAGVAALATGLSARSDHGSWVDECQAKGPVGDCDSRRGSIESRVVATNALLGTAGVLAAGSVVLFFVEGRRPDQRRSSAPRLAPMVGSGAGLVLGGHF